jgi:hypothetical protein
MLYTIQGVDYNDGEFARTLTDDEAAVYFPPQLLFSADKPHVAADGKSVITITLQSMTVPLSDDKRREIHEARKVTIIEDGEYTDIELDDNGRAEIRRAFVAVGTYEFKPHELLAGIGVTVEAL